MAGPPNEHTGAELWAQAMATVVPTARTERLADERERREKDNWERIRRRYNGSRGRTRTVSMLPALSTLAASGGGTTAWPAELLPICGAIQFFRRLATAESPTRPTGSLLRVVGAGK